MSPSSTLPSKPLTHLPLGSENDKERQGKVGPTFVSPPMTPNSGGAPMSGQHPSDDHHVSKRQRKKEFINAYVHIMEHLKPVTLSSGEFHWFQPRDEQTIELKVYESFLESMADKRSKSKRKRDMDLDNDNDGGNLRNVRSEGIPPERISPESIPSESTQSESTASESTQSESTLPESISFEALHAEEVHSNGNSDTSDQHQTISAVDSSPVEAPNRVYNTRRSTRAETLKKPVETRPIRPNLFDFYDEIDIDIPDDEYYPQDWMPRNEAFVHFNRKFKWKVTPMDITAMPYYERLHPKEAEFASIFRIEPARYLRCKRTVIMKAKAFHDNGLPFRKSNAQRSCRVDVNKTSQLMDMFTELGWLEKHSP